MKKSHLVMLSTLLLVLGLAMVFKLSGGHAQITLPATTGMIAPTARGAGIPSGILTCNANSQYIEYINTLTNQVSYCDGTNWDAEVGAVPYLSGATGTITGTLLAVGGSDTGTATVTGAVAGQPCDVSTTDGSNPSSSSYVHCEVTAANTVTVTITAFAISTPASKAYNVRVFP